MPDAPSPTDSAPEPAPTSIPGGAGEWQSQLHTSVIPPKVDSNGEHHTPAVPNTLPHVGPQSLGGGTCASTPCSTVTKCHTQNAPPRWNNQVNTCDMHNGLGTAATPHHRNTQSTAIVPYRPPLMQQYLQHAASECLPCSVSTTNYMNPTAAWARRNEFADTISRLQSDARENHSVVDLQLEDMPLMMITDAVHEPEPDDLDQFYRPTSPIGVADISDVELPGLVSVSESDSESTVSTTDDEFSDDEWAFPTHLHQRRCLLTHTGHYHFIAHSLLPSASGGSVPPHRCRSR